MQIYVKHSKILPTKTLAEDTFDKKEITYRRYVSYIKNM